MIFWVLQPTKANKAMNQPSAITFVILFCY